MTTAQLLRLTNSITFKGFLLAFLLLCLMVPTMMVRGVIEERRARAQTVREDIAKSWAPTGMAFRTPFLLVPYTITGTVQENVGGQILTRLETKTKIAHLYPEALDVASNLPVSIKKRSIFEATVFNGQIRMSGKFRLTNAMAHGGMGAASVDWASAKFVLPLPHPKVLRGQTEFRWNGQAQPLTASGDLNGHKVFHLGTPTTGVSMEALEKGIPFSLGFRGAGTGGFSFVPRAADFSLTMSASWSSPSFYGESLPMEHKITPNGFSARWQESIHQIGLPLWDTGMELPQDQASTSGEIGVNFFQSVDIYHQSDRALKYAFLFILLTFGAFFIFEIRAGLRLHLFHYAQVGLANVIFFLLLFSLSEHINFTLAYALASTSVVTVIGLYASSILKARSRSIPLSIGLVVAYGILYGLLREEDYSLLIGSVGLLVGLALVMFFTRKVEFGRLDALRSEEVDGNG